MSKKLVERKKDQGKVCDVVEDGVVCGLRVVSGTLCRFHYDQLRKTGHVLHSYYLRKGRADICRVIGKDGRVCGVGGRIRMGMCDFHYYRYSSFGHPLAIGAYRGRDMDEDDVYEWFYREKNVKKESGADGCWLWQGAMQRGAKNVYGLFSYKGERYAHRVSWMLNYGEIEDGKSILRRCGKSLCVRPDHLIIP